MMRALSGTRWDLVRSMFLRCLFACLFACLFIRSFVGSLVGWSVRRSVRSFPCSFVACLVGWWFPFSHCLPFADRWLWNREGLRWCMKLCLDVVLHLTSEGRRRSHPYVVATSMTCQKRTEGFSQRLFHSLISIQCP